MTKSNHHEGVKQMEPSQVRAVGPNGAAAVKKFSSLTMLINMRLTCIPAIPLLAIHLN